MSQIKDLLERILSFAAKRAEVHFNFAKEKEDDGAMFFTEDYKAYISILDDATTVLDLLKQQPTAGEFTKRIREWYTENLTNPEKMVQYQRNVKSSWIKSMKELKEVCDRLDTAEARLKAMYAGDLSPESRLSGYKVITDQLKLRIDELKAINKELLEACEKVQDWLDTSSLQQVLVHYTEDKRKHALIMGIATHLERLEAAIAKAKRDR